MSLHPEIAEVLEGKRRWTVICADNAEILPALPEKSVGVTLTDPPYSAHVHGKSRRGSSLPDGNGEKWHGESRGGNACISRAVDLGFASLTPEEMRRCAAEFGRLTRRWCLVFSDLEMAREWQTSLAARGLDHIRFGIWIKVGCTPQFTGDRPATGAEAISIAHPKGRKKWNGGGSHAVWPHPIVLERGDGTLRVHTTQKPLPLMLELVSLFTDEDEVILDPFAGSGTTGVAAIRFGRRFIGIERNEKYAALARERLEAESQGLSLRDARAGQLSLLGGVS